MPDGKITCKSNFDPPQINEIVEQNTYRYIAGYFARNFHKKHSKCSDCDILFDTSGNYSNSSLCLIKNKNYFKTPVKDKGLVVCSESFYAHCDEIKSLFYYHFFEKFAEANVRKQITEICMNVDRYQFCSQALKIKLTQKLVKFLINTVVKFWNKKISTNKHAINRKRKIICHE